MASNTEPFALPVFFMNHTKGVRGWKRIGPDAAPYFLLCKRDAGA
jgi:hypothetical protein